MVLYEKWASAQMRCTLTDTIFYEYEDCFVNFDNIPLFSSVSPLQVDLDTI